MTISINNVVQKVSTKRDLSSLIDLSFDNLYNEIWISGAEGSTLSVLTNQDKAFLMYLKFNGDSGSSSINVSLTETDQYEDFILNNGQKDSYSIDQLVAKEVAKEALIYFFEFESKIPTIKWRED